MIAIGFLSYMVWGHHMFVSGMNRSRRICSRFQPLSSRFQRTILTLLLIGTVYGAKMRFTTPRFSASVSFRCLSAEESAGSFCTAIARYYLHATYFVVAHFHFVMAVASIFGVFAATYFWFPKMYGRMMSDTLASGTSG